MNFYIRAIRYYLQSLMDSPFFKSLISMAWWVMFYLIGDPSAGVYAFIVLCIMDFVIGVCYSLYNGNFSWLRFLRWAMKYVAFWIAVTTARQLDLVISDVLDVVQGLSTHMILFQYRMIWYLAIHEATSILGKLEEMGVPIPSGMRQRIKEYQERLEKKVPETTVIQQTVVIEHKTPTL